MIRIQGKDGRVRSVGGGDPKLKVALPPVAQAQPLEAKREKAAVAMAKAVNTVNTPAPVNKDRNAYMREYMRKKRSKGTPPTQG